MYEKEGEKMEKYQDLKREVGKLWGISRSEIHQGTGASFKILTNR